MHSPNDSLSSRCDLPRRLLLALLLILLAGASAQAPTPSLDLSDTDVTLGSPVVLTGEDFAPESDVLLVWTSPDEEVISEQVETDENGAFRYETRLETAGPWRLELRAGELRRSFDVEVRALETEPESAAESDQAPADEAAESGGEGLAERFGVTPPLARDREDAAEVEASPSPEALELDIVENDVVAMRGERVAWRLSFAGGSGPTGALLEDGDELYVGHGNSVLRLEPESGRVLDRWLVPGPVRDLDARGRATEIVVAFDDGLSQTLTLVGDEMQETVRFGVEPETFDWLAAEARVSDPRARMEQDPTNPWLYLAAGAALPAGSEQAEAYYRQAVETAQTFYDLAGISRELVAAGQMELAAEAFDRALADFAARDYDPGLLRDWDLAEAYNFPPAPLEEATRRGDLDEADFWAERLMLAAPRVEGARAALRDYAGALEDAGNPVEAAYWRNAARPERQVTVSGGLDRMMNRLGAVGWEAALALLVAALLLYLTLWAKYWLPQSDVLEVRRGRGQSAVPATRVFAIRYFGFGEKLVLVLMMAAALALAGLAAWSDRGDDLPLAARSGTLANVQAQRYLASEQLEGPRAAFIRGYAAQVSEQTQQARQFYAEAGNYAPALNNLGVLNDDQGLLRRALALTPDLPEARHNLGQQQGGFPFQERYRQDEGVLAVPTPQDFQVALAGDWQGSLAGTFSNPWTTLIGARPFGLHVAVWTVVLLVFLALGVLAVVWMLIPRPGVARNAPRTPLYHLLALLIPGSGLADEAWGLLLLVPWAIVGLDTLSELFGWGVDAGLSLRWDYVVLVILYLINLIAFLVEFASYRRRMTERRRRIGAA